MYYHNILTDDMRNGSGLRVVLFVSGCNHHCKGCHNPQTWDSHSGVWFDALAENELFDKLGKDHISGITFSGGDPLHHSNLPGIYHLAKKVKENHPDKSIWMYTGYTWEELHDESIDTRARRINRLEILKHVDVIVDGRFKEELSDVNYHWAGSTNQRVIDVQKTLKEGKVILWHD